LRVLHVTPYFAPAYRYGGPPRSILGLCRALGDAGVDVEVFTTTANGDEPLPAAPQGIVHEGVRVRYFPLAWPRRYWRASGLRAALRRAAADADLVHVHGLWNMTSWAGVAAARAAGKPYLVSPRGMLQPEARQRHRGMKSLAYWGIERANLRDAAMLHATSALEGRELTQYGPPVMLIPNGVSLREATPESIARLRARADVRDGDDVVTFLGRLHPIKRLDLLADAFAIVHSARPNARLAIAGPDEGGYRQHIEAMFAPVSAVTRWLGDVDSDAIAALLASTDVLVQCSDSESFGMSVAEALTAGVPVVVTKPSGWAEVGALGCGFSVAHEPVSIADGILRVLDHADRAALRARAGAWARKTFAWDAIGTAMRTAYEQAISRAGRKVA
jgi:glycosyltransferase involved in cell wall biosynthesis